MLQAVPKTEQIYQKLRHAIIRLALQPGMALAEKDLSLEFGVSRTPVREAIQRLAEEGLVDIFPRSGTYVSPISFAVAEEGFVIRRALEIESVRRACSHITVSGIAGLNDIVARMRMILGQNRFADYIDEDDRFHAAIAAASGMPRLWRFIDLAKVHLDRMRQLSAPVPGHLAEVTEQHAAIVDALTRRNADQAELAMRIHLDSSFAVMAGLLQNQDAFFNTETRTGKATPREKAGGR